MLIKLANDNDSCDNDCSDDEQIYLEQKAARQQPKRKSVKGHGLSIETQMQHIRRQVQLEKVLKQRQNLQMVAQIDEKEEDENTTNIGSQMFKSLYKIQNSQRSIDMEDDCVTDLNDILKGQQTDLDQSLSKINKS